MGELFREYFGNAKRRVRRWRRHRSNQQDVARGLDIFSRVGVRGVAARGPDSESCRIQAGERPVIRLSCFN